MPKGYWIPHIDVSDPEGYKAYMAATPAAHEKYGGRALVRGGTQEVVEGKGRSRIGEQTFEWGPRDLFVVPSWQWATHEADADSVLFSFSDRPVQQKLDLFREDRGNA